MQKHWRYLAVAALVVYVVLFWFWSSLGFPTEGQICAEAKQGGHVECAPHNFIVYGFIFIDRYHDALLVIGTFLLAGFVLIQLRDARKSSERQLRAYVMAYGVGVEYTDTGIRTKIELANTGQTPAKDVKILTRSDVLLHPIQRGFQFIADDAGTAPSSETIGAGKTSQSEVTLENSEVMPGEAQDFNSKDGWLRIYVYGTVRYRDVFDDAQWTNFCFYYDWAGTKVTAHVSEYHNDAS